VPEIILPNSQTSGYIQIGDTFAILSAFVPGNHFEGSLNQLQNAGRQVAILTNALKEETPSFQTQVSAYFNVHAKYRGINDLQQALDLVKKNKDSKPHPYLDLILSREEDLRNICIAMDAKYEHISTTQIVHGDLHPHNFIGNEPYITDLGEIRLAPVIEDIGFALHRLVRQGVAYQNQISKSEAVAQSAKAFISGFTKVSSLPSDVITGATQVAIKKVVRATNLWFTDWQGDKQGDKWLGQMPKFIDSLDEIAYIEKAIHD
jgi:Ser/Thr protein kinase RdoA (MazF antagonist)